MLANWRSGAWLLRPSASVAYLEEDQHAYRSSTGVDMFGQSISIGQAKFGPEISYEFAVRNGLRVVPSLTAEAIWNFHEEANGGLLLDDLVTGEEWRGRLEAGLTILSAGGLSLGASATYDGVGDSDFQAIGGRARVKVPLN
jgi:outer membrane autotransporter protein